MIYRRFSQLYLHASPTMPGSERQREIRRRRKRRQQIDNFKEKLPKATNSEKVEIARKLREITPGAEVLISSWGLEEVDR